MTGIDAWRRQLLDMPESERLRFLDQHSGLPGPRGNIELALAFADLAPAAVIDDLARSDDEYRAFCGTVALGSRAEDAEVLLRLHRAASDQRWRVREAVAGICEPRLLRDPRMASAAVEVCRRTTERLSLRPWTQRRDPAVRALRQGLGYCWSVAVAASPQGGGEVFAALDRTDPDVDWIVRENLRKRRMPPQVTAGSAPPGREVVARERL